MMPPVSDNTALLLDIDGTLLDLARTPDSVKVPRDLVRALEALTRRLSGALAFVSGRSLASIDRLFGVGSVEESVAEELFQVCRPVGLRVDRFDARAEPSGLARGVEALQRVRQ